MPREIWHSRLKPVKRTLRPRSGCAPEIRHSQLRSETAGGEGEGGENNSEKIWRILAWQMRKIELTWTSLAQSEYSELAIPNEQSVFVLNRSSTCCLSSWHILCNLPENAWDLLVRLVPPVPCQQKSITYLSSAVPWAWKNSPACKSSSHQQIKWFSIGSLHISVSALKSELFQLE